MNIRNFLVLANKLDKKGNYKTSDKIFKLNGVGRAAKSDILSVVKIVAPIPTELIRFP